MDADGIRRALTRIAYEIVEKKRDSGCCFGGNKTSGVPLAHRLAGFIEKMRVKTAGRPAGYYTHRDDRTERSIIPAEDGAAALELEVTEKVVVLVDDVLFTGRSVRAAMEALINAAGRA